MPVFGKRSVNVSHGGSYVDGKKPVSCNHMYTIKLNSRGKFYADIPEDLHEVAATFGAKKPNRHPSKLQMFGDTLDELLDKLEEVHEAYLSPKTTKVNVIRFNIITEVSFAETPEGEICPNGYYGENARWPEGDEKRKYGEQIGNRVFWGGYSLQIGAKAETKITRQYGNGSVRVSYETYSGEDGNKLGRNHPAARLNAWTKFSLKNPREIPYTDAAAIFFFDLMFGMASLAKKIQNHVFEKEDLLKLIDSRQALLPAPEIGDGG